MVIFQTTATVCSIKELCGILCCLAAAIHCGTRFFTMANSSASGSNPQTDVIRKQSKYATALELELERCAFNKRNGCYACTDRCKSAAFRNVCSQRYLCICFSESTHCAHCTLYTPNTLYTAECGAVFPRVACVWPACRNVLLHTMSRLAHVHTAVRCSAQRPQNCVVRVAATARVQAHIPYRTACACGSCRGSDAHKIARSGIPGERHIHARERAPAVLVQMQCAA